MKRPISLSHLLAVILCFAPYPASGADNSNDSDKPAQPPIPIGVARLDISPQRPVHIINELEANEAEEIASPLFARALAIGKDKPAVLVVYDGIGVTAAISDRVANALNQSAGLPRENVVVAATHTHWAPHLSQHLPYIYRGPLPPTHQAQADAYTEQLIGHLVGVAERALADRVPCQLSWTSGQVGFAANRRLRGDGRVSVDEALMHTWNPDAPVDHRLPLLQARREDDGSLHGLLFTYACHNVALTGRDISQFSNRFHGDWAGLATQELEQRHPGVVAICTIGCGGDQRPTPCGGLTVAEAHARSIADEVERLLTQPGRFAALAASPRCARVELDLATEPIPEREVLEKYVAAIASHSRSAVARGWAASRRLDALEAGQAVDETVPFAAHAWSFASALSLVFLSGEVTVDYARLLDEAHPETPLWVTAYANDIPCYIVSRELLAAGGYEATTSMYYYGRLTPLKPEAEEQILKAVAALHAKHVRQP